MCTCNRALINGRCPGCGRSAFCRCRPVEAERPVRWLEVARERRNGLAKELSAA